MIENPRSEDENTIKDIEIFLDQKKKMKKLKTEYLDIRNILRLEKENKAIEDIILRNIRNLFENQEEKQYYKPVRVSKFWSNHIDCKYKSDRSKTLSVEEFLNKIRPYLKDINNLK